MGLIQNKVTVSQPNSHVVVKNAGGLRGLTGETGQQGPQGVPGEAATVTAGTTTTLPAGSDATVQNVGSTSAAIFNFGIPKGDKGDTGETGTAATISVGTTTTLEPGEDATVTNSGTSSAAVFDFGIPKGAKGDTGSQGPAGQDGADGFSPTATVTKTGDTATITITDKDGTTTAQISDGVTPTIDPALSPTSENPVQNKVVTNALAGKADKPIVVSSLPTTGTAGQEYFVDDRYNTVTELKGDTEQTTYSGKNLFDKNSAATGYIVSRETGVNEGNVNYVASDYIAVQAGEKYRFGSTINRWYSAYYDSNKQYTGYPTNTAVITIPSGVAYIRVSTQVTNVDTAQFEKGEVETSYEPYVGGTASPNPDYPQEVKTVTGEQTVTIASKNILANIANLNATDNGITDTLNADGSITCSGIVGNGWNGWNISGYIANSLPAGTYTFSIDQAILYDINVSFRDAANNTLDTAHITAGQTSATVTISGQTARTSLWVAATVGTQIDFTISAMLEKGSLASSFVPYATQAYPINLGKNLFDKDNANTLGAYIESSGSHGIVNDSASTCIWVACETNTTYTISRTAGNVFRAVTTSTTPTTGLTTSNYVGNDSGTSITIPTGANGKYIVIEVRNFSSSSSLDDILATIQIEKGSTATTYAPYFTPIELCKIGTYQDYIYKSGEDWYVHKEVGKSVMGSLTWNPASTGTSGVYRMYSDGITGTVLIPSTGSEIAKIVCSHYTPETAANTWSTMVGVAVQTTDGRLFVYDSNYNTNTSQSAFTTWLTNNNVVIYYALRTSTDTQITDATLIAQLEALAGAKIMVDGGTATVTSQYLPATLTTEYSSNSGYIEYIYDGTNFVKVR